VQIKIQILCYDIKQLSYFQGGNFMKRLIFLGVTVLSISTSIFAAGNSCLGNSKINKSEVEKALSPILGNAKVVSVSDAPIAGLYEVVIQANGKKVPVYIDCSLKYLVNGEIIDIKNKKSITRERFMQLSQEANQEKEKEFVKILGDKKLQELKKAFPGILERASIVNAKNIPQTNIIFGNPQAKKVVYVVTDPQCPFCAKLHQSITELLKERNDIAFKMIFYPLPFHKYAKAVSENVICSNDKSLLDKSFETVLKNDEASLSKLAKACDKANSTIEANIKYGQANGINGTPTIIFPNGLAISGAMSKDDLKKLIDIIF